jgi:hypothetical protein
MNRWRNTGVGISCCCLSSSPSRGGIEEGMGCREGDIIVSIFLKLINQILFKSSGKFSRKGARLAEKGKPFVLD